MKQHGKRLFLLLMAMCMLFGLLPVGSIATETAQGNAVEFVAQQLSLGDDLTMRFYVSIDASYAEDAAMNITVDGQTVTQYVKDMEADSDGYYVFNVDLAAAQMTTDIELDFVSGGASIAHKTYTIQNYARVLLEGGYTDETKKMVKEMLNYGAKAQLYFDYKTGKLANAGYEIEVSDTVPSEVPSTTISGTVEGIKYYGATLLFESKVAVRYYFTAPNGVEGYTFTVNDVAYTAESKDGLYFVEIPGINPQDLDKNVSIAVSDNDSDDSLTVNYSPMHYICRMYNKDSTSAALKTLLHAMYGYHKAASVFVGVESFLDLTPVKPGDYSENEAIPEI